MKIPKSVTILGRRFKVKICSIKQIEKETDVKNADGAMSYLKKIILVNESLPHEEQIVTFLHECNHAIDYISGFSQILDNNTFELLAETRATGFYDVFKAIIKGH